MKRLFSMMSIILFITMLAACSEEEPEENTTDENRVVPVETAEVEEGDFALKRTVHGRTAPEQVTPVLLQAPGEVSELHVENGEEVEEGDELATVATAQGNITITAPADGEVANLEGSEGAMATSEEPFALILETENMNLELSVTADIRELFNRDETYTATKNETEYEATITEIASMPNDTGLYPVIARIENPNQSLLTGMIMELELTENLIESVLIVPTSAVVWEEGDTFVYVIEDDTAMMREITIEESGTNETVIDGDIAPGDEVVISGQLTLSDGDRVAPEKGE